MSSKPETSPEIAETGARTPLLRVQNLKMHFPITKGVLYRQVGTVRAVDDVSFEVYEGEVFGLVGESGCGKTTTGRCITRVLTPTAGSILYRLKDGTEVDLSSTHQRDLKRYRREIRMIFQDPFASLNPRLPVIEIVGEVLKVNKLMERAEIRERARSLLEYVGLRPEYLERYPHAFSGGERQRVGIARALAPEPRLVVADEAVSALDVSIQAQTVNLLQDLQADFGLTYIFIAHDLSVVEHICDRIGVMYVGKLVETGTKDDVFASPAHPYSEALLSAVPKPDPRLRGRGNRVRLPGDVADPSNPPSGCYFHPRCPYAQEICKHEEPLLKDHEVSPGHFSACHFAEELALKGVLPPAQADNTRSDSVEQSVEDGADTDGRE